MYDIQKKEDAIRMTQTFLLEISYTDDDIPHVSVDGIYGERTRRAIRIFQRKKGITETGRTDFETWQALFDAYMDAFEYNEKERRRVSQHTKDSDMP